MSQFAIFQAISNRDLSALYQEVVKTPVNARDRVRHLDFCEPSILIVVQNGDSPLHLGAQLGWVEGVKLLIQNNYSITATNDVRQPHPCVFLTIVFSAVTCGGIVCVDRVPA
jgi:hypothetical protein